MSDPHDSFGPLTRQGQTPEGAFIRGQREMLDAMAARIREGEERFESIHGTTAEGNASPAGLDSSPARPTALWPDPAEERRQSRIARQDVAYITMKPGLRERLAGMTYSYLQHDGAFNADAQGHLREPQLVAREIHAQRLQRTYRAYWERVLGKLDADPGEDEWLRSMTPAQLVKLRTVANERLELLDRGFYLRSGFAGNNYIAYSRRYILECRVFGWVLFSVHNPLTRKVRVDAFDRYIRRYVAANCERLDVRDPYWLRKVFKPASELIWTTFWYPWN